MGKKGILSAIQVSLILVYLIMTLSSIFLQPLYLILGIICVLFFPGYNLLNIIKPQFSLIERLGYTIILSVLSH